MDLQFIFFEENLDHTLQTQKRKSILRVNPGDPNAVWGAHKLHKKKSDASRSAGADIISTLTSLRISNAKSRVDFLEEFDTNIKNYAEIMQKPLADDIKTAFLEKAVQSDSKLLSQYSATQ